MNHDMSYYRKIQNAWGSASPKETALRVAQARLNRDFRHTMNWETVTVNGAPRELTIVPGENARVKEIHTRPGEILVLGNLVQWALTQWLITDVDFDHQAYASGRMTQCNTVLRWQDAEGGILSIYAVVEDATKYGTGLSMGQYLDTGDFTVKARLPLTAETRPLGRDKRFLLADGAHGYQYTAFVVTRVNHVTQTYDIAEQPEGQGYLELTMREDQLRPQVDNLELGVADYRDPAAPETPESGWFG